MAIEYFTGDDAAFKVAFRKADGTAYPISNSATVKSSIRRENPDGNAELVAGPWTCASSLAGANWAAGDVIAVIQGAGTLNVSPGVYYLEVNVDVAGSDLTRVPKQALNIRKRTQGP